MKSTDEFRNRQGDDTQPLAFQSLRPQQEYFADGMSRRSSTALSRFKSLFVIARNSSFTFKDKSVDINEVGPRLGVRYILEGSVRKAWAKVRVTGQLADAVTCAGRIGLSVTRQAYLRPLDEVTIAVVSVIAQRLFFEGMAMTTRRRPENLTDTISISVPCSSTTERPAKGWPRVIRLVDRALERDPWSRLWQVSLTRITSCLATRPILCSSIRKQFGLLAWHCAPTTMIQKR